MAWVGSSQVVHPARGVGEKAKLCRAGGTRQPEMAAADIRSAAKSNIFDQIENYLPIAQA